VVEVSGFKLEAHSLASGLSEVDGRGRIGRVNASTLLTLATGTVERGVPVCVWVSC
jgi:hypothetical protein